MSHDLQKIIKQASELYDRAQTKEMTLRDVALAVELNQQYAEYLDELVNTAKPYHAEVVIKTGEEKIKFQNVDRFANWLAEHIT